MVATYRIKVLQKALGILDLFNEQGKELTNTEIHQSLNLNKSTTARILNVLESEGCVERDPLTLKYRLGVKVYYLGSLVEGFGEIKKLAFPFLQWLNEKCGETIHLVVLDRGEAFYLEKIEGKGPIRVVSQVGKRLPAHCSGVGKILLSSLSEDELCRIIKERGLKRFTRNTIVNMNALKSELISIRKRGYAIDNEEVRVGLKCLAAPIRDANNQLIAAFSIAAPKERLGEDIIKRYIPLVLEVSAKISNFLKIKDFKLRTFH